MLIRITCQLELRVTTVESVSKVAVQKEIRYSLN